MQMFCNVVGKRYSESFKNPLIYIQVPIDHLSLFKH